MPPRTGERTRVPSGDIVRNSSSLDSCRSADILDDAIYSFEWRPVHIYHRLAKKSMVPEIQAQCAKVGITFSTGSGGAFPTAMHTHYVIPKLQREANVLQLAGGIDQLTFVTAAWVDKLVAAAYTVVGRSKLEEDFLGNWPSELEYFPEVEGKPDNSLERDTWQPKPGRKTLFKQAIFADFSGVRRSDYHAPVNGRPHMR